MADDSLERMDGDGTARPQIAQSEDCDDAIIALFYAADWVFDEITRTEPRCRATTPRLWTDSRDRLDGLAKLNR